MIYSNTFIFPNENVEFDFIIEEKRTCYDSFYQFKILSQNRFEIARQITGSLQNTPRGVRLDRICQVCTICEIK